MIPTSSREPGDAIRPEAATTAVAATFGLRVGEVGRGRVTATVPVRPTPGATLGPVLVLADLVLGAAIASADPGSRVRTLRLGVSTAAPPPRAGTLHGEARLLASSGESATSHGTVAGDDGRVVVTMTTRCTVRPAPATAADPAPAPPLPAPVADPWARLGLDGDPSGVLEGAPQLANRSGLVQGGVVAAVLAHAAEHALGFGGDEVSLDLDVAYLRGVAADGARLPVTVEVVHRGRRYGLARASVLDGTGRQAATATLGVWSPGGA